MRVAIYAKLFSIAACFAAGAQPAPSDKNQLSPAEHPPEGAQVEPPGNASGMKVFIDPQTGAFLQEPATTGTPLELSPEDRNRLSTSHQGLVEEQNPVPGGGVRLDLQGRFRNPLTVTIGPDGNVTMQHRQLDTPTGDTR
jgi:hypothetical protein